MAIKSMTVAELKQALDQNDQDRNSQIILVDVRKQEEWDTAHIPAASFLPLDQLAERFNELPKDRPLVLQCRSGGRSLKAAQFLEQQGYQDLTNLEGGLLAWIDAGHDVSRS